MKNYITIGDLIDTITPDVEAAFRREDILGFDYLSQAVAAVYGHKDFATRWEFEHPEGLELIAKWKEAQKLKYKGFGIIYDDHYDELS